MIAIYTPDFGTSVTLKSTSASNRPFKLQVHGWLDVVEGMGIDCGVEIDCWSVYLAEGGEEGNLSLLIEKVKQKNENKNYLNMWTCF